MTFSSIRRSCFSRLISLCLMAAFVVTMVITPRPSYAQGGVPGLPEPGTMVNLSSSYVPLMLTGLTVHPENPLLIDFIVSTGNSGLNAAQVKEQSNRLIKYFLACLTIPENDQWVNLSPYEKQRIVPEDLGQTILGRDMLAQDYLLKQLTASLIYPEKNLGKSFWNKVYAKANQMYGTTQIPVNTFNKVWILPDTAKVFEHKDTVFVVKSHLKVMLDEDYLALNRHSEGVHGTTEESKGVLRSFAKAQNDKSINNLASQIIRPTPSSSEFSEKRRCSLLAKNILQEIILPAIEQEANTGKNFSQLRQIYNSMILAVWFKKNLKQALLNQVYTDKAKVNGVNVDDPSIKEKIYKQYLQAYKKGVFNYIKEEADQNSQEVIPRKYFSGGLTPVDAAMLKPATKDEAMAAFSGPGRSFLVSGLTQNVKENSMYNQNTGSSLATTNQAMTAEAIQNEKTQALLVGNALHTVLDPQRPSSINFLKGGYNQPGFGIAAGAVNDGSHAINDEGDQGYYVNKTNVPDGNGGYKSGHQVFIDTVHAMESFFKRRAKAIGRPLKIVIKPGIGGQHTPFQGIADMFEVIDPDSGKIVGEYELGKNWERSIANVLKIYQVGWDQIAVIPSSKSGSTDETMQIFVEIFKLLLEKIADQKGSQGKLFADAVINYLHEINFDQDGKELPGKDLFKKFNMDALKFKCFLSYFPPDKVEEIIRVVLGNMFFETTDRPADSRLSAFIRNPGLDKSLGEDAPGFGYIFDNVGGRWAGDFHMMTFLAFHGLDADAYWQARYEGIKKVREGTHEANALANTILDKGIKKIALVVPDELFWFGKASEQNFNESIWQEGFANLRAVHASDWQQQAKHYKDTQSLVINLSDILIGEGFQTFSIIPVNIKEGKQKLAQEMARLFTTFYGMTYTVGTRLIARALEKAGLNAGQIDVSDLNNPATLIFQRNLFLRQPFVELGKGLLQKFFEDLQVKQQQWVKYGQPSESPIDAETNRVIRIAQATDARSLSQSIRKALQTAQAEKRTFVPFIYLDGKEFTQLRQELVKLGIEWVLQGTGDQHISWQQVLANPDQYLPFIVSFVPSKKEMTPGIPAIGFARGYLHGISPHLIRHFFAWFSYEALLGQKGKGKFISLVDNDQERQYLVGAFKQAAAASPVMTAAALAKIPGGIDFNSSNLNMESEGQKVNITFDPAMIEQFRRGDFSGVRIQILDVVPLNLMLLLGLKKRRGVGAVG